MPSTNPKLISGINFFLIFLFLAWHIPLNSLSAQSVQEGPAPNSIAIPKESAGPAGLKQLPRKDDDTLTAFQSEARYYRQQGMDYQNNGELETALDCYQKAVVLDPFYAVAYNDLGVIYEAFGQQDRAEDAYLKALKIDPGLLGTYSNLAMFYESKRDLRQAAYYWNKRAQMGFVDDPWTQKARERYEDIEAVLYGKESRWEKALREKEAAALLSQVTKEKDMGRAGDPGSQSTQYYKKLKDRYENPDEEASAKAGAVDAKAYFDKAKQLEGQGEDVTALKTAIDAQNLDPANKEIQEFIDKLQHKVLTR